MWSEVGAVEEGDPLKPIVLQVADTALGYSPLVGRDEGSASLRALAKTMRIEAGELLEHADELEALSDALDASAVLRGAPGLS